jgi:hypothetical protein
MNKVINTAVLACTAVLIAKVGNTSFVPGSRITILAHNAFPDRGKYEDRLDRAIASGLPLVVEEDLAWIDGKSLLVRAGL